jgi:hypothetical protein
MSVTAPSQTTASPPAHGAGHIVLASIGGVVAAFGGLLAIAGVALLVSFGSDGRISSGAQAINTPTSALVTSAARIDDTAEIADVVGDTSIQVAASSAGERPVFVGVGPTADVDRYLAGAAVDEVTDFDVDPFRLERRTTRGSATPAPPADESFWVAQSTGSGSAAVDWKVRDGSYRLVVMNADGSQRVATQTTVGVTIDDLSDVSWGLLIIGLVLIAGGTLTLVLSLRRRA